jgi:predicted RNA-binding Zn ribbon-like protein
MKSLSLLMLLCIFSVANAQFDEPKFGKIDMAEMTMSRYDKDTTAEALTLFDVGNTKFILNRDRRFQYVFERHCRIKIFKKSAFDIADRSIRLYKSGSNEEKISNLNAVTYNLVGGKIVKTKLDNDKI